MNSCSRNLHPSRAGIFFCPTGGRIVVPVLELLFGLLHFIAVREGYERVEQFVNRRRQETNQGLEGWFIWR